MPRKKKLRTEIIHSTEYTRQQPLIHPAIKRIFGTMLLAGDFREGTQILVTQKAFEWVNQREGRAFHVSNNGKDVIVTFSVNGKECDAPF